MKKIIGVALILGFTLSASSQDATNKVEVTKGEEFKDANRITLKDVIGDYEGKTYVLFEKPVYGGVKYSIGRVGTSLKFEGSEDIELGRGTTLSQATLFGGQIIFFFNVDDNSQKEKRIEAHIFDKETLKPTGQIKTLATVKTESYKDRKTSSVDFVTSFDKSKLLVIANSPLQKGEAGSFGLHIYDEDLTEFWSKEIELPYTDEIFELDKYVVTNDGDVFVLGKVLNEKKDQKKADPTGRYIILEYSKKGDFIQEYAADFGDYFINNMILKTSADQEELICAGFLREGKKSGTSGAFIMRLDRKTKEAKNREVVNFTAEFVAQDQKRGAAKKTISEADKGIEVGIANLVSRGFVRADDGGFVLHGEQFYSGEGTLQQGGSTASGSNYYHEHIIVVKFTADNKIQWTQKIPKMQATANDNGNYSSYALHARKDKMFFIFNDNPKNLAYKGDGKVAPLFLKDSFISIVELDANGKISRESLLGPQGKGLYARPRVASQINDNEMIMYSEDKGKKGFMRIKFVQ